MYATVRQLKFDESFKDESKRLAQRELLPKLREIPGFIDYYLIFTTEKEIGYSVGLFSDKKGCEIMNKVSNDFLKEWKPKVKIEKMTEGEVVLQARFPATV